MPAAPDRPLRDDWVPDNGTQRASAALVSARQAVSQGARVNTDAVVAAEAADESSVDTPFPDQMPSTRPTELDLPSLISVLVIDQDAGQHSLIERALATASGHVGEHVRFEVSYAGSLSEGLDLLATGGIDAVLLDLALPDSTGLDTLIRLREEHQGVPIVVLTDIDDEELALRAVASGAQDYLLKSRIHAHVILRVLLFARERQRMQTELRELALIDALTGLHNRRGFLASAEQMLRIARRSGRGLVMIFLDLDHLKTLNDTLGHDEGDRALVSLAEVLRGTFRTSDMVARIGGDEFAVLAIDAPPGAVSQLTERLMERIETHNAQSEHPATLSISMGTAILEPEDPGGVEDLLARADRAMYAHKREKLKAERAPTG